MALHMLTDWPEIASTLRGRYCFLVRGLDGGGAQQDAILLANELQRRGRPSAIATLDGRGHLRQLIDPDVPVVDLGHGGKLRLAQSFGSLRRLIAQSRPAALISSEAAANVVCVIASRGIRARPRPRLILREVASPLQARRNDPYWQNRLAYKGARLAYPLADLVLTFTAGARDDLIRGFGVPANRVVSLGTNAVVTPAMRQRIAHTPRVPEPDLIVSVGRLSREKGYAGLIEAFALLRRQRPARLLIVGEGDERRPLETLIAARGLGADVTLAGHTDPLPALARAALYVCASAHEGLGNAMIEALASGVPVVSTDAPHGPREILEGGRLGQLVPVGDAAALAAAMATALDGTINAEALRARGADFTVEAAGTRFLEVIDAIDWSDRPATARRGTAASPRRSVSKTSHSQGQP